MFWKRCIEVLAVLFLWSSAAVPVVLSAEYAVRPSSSLENTMTTIKDSIVTLIAENKSLAETNESLRAKIKVMSEQVRALKNDESRLRARMNTVDTHFLKRRGSVDGLQKSFNDEVQVLEGLKNEQLMIEADLKSKDGTADDFQNRVDALQKETQGLTSVADPAAGLGPRLEALQAERAGLERELAEGTSRVKLLKNEWQGLSVAVSSGSGQAKAFEKDHSQLQQDLARKRDALERLKQQSFDQEKLLEEFSNEVSAAALMAQRQGEVDALDLELQTLQNIVGALEEKVALLDKGEDRESHQRKKKEEFLKDLSVRNMSLKSELSREEQEMVKMDKKKSLLEKVLYQPKY
jgi:chromosome segregation ATPase